MFGSIGLALGAVSTISSLLESAAAEIGKAAGNTPLQAAGQTFSASTAATAAPASTNPASQEPGAVFPKFDQRMQAALLAFQEMHRGA